ncbi:MAG: filamentous hemagglutinin N-terminal domain-containing protein [Cyanobacteria bacterium J06629_18]
MKNKTRKSTCIYNLFFGITTFCTIISSTNIVSAEIVPDNTLPNNSKVKVEENKSIIEGGTTAGSNLFHSFEKFGIDTENQAHFNNAVDISNIITRVTGKSISDIDGLIKANGSANLFLINPNGIVFGENSSLDLQGSFVGTTASGLQFGEQGNFSATNPEIPGSLTINPSALFFNQVEANGGIINKSQAFAGINPDGNFTTGLRVPNGKSLLLVGGDINFDGGRLRAYEGNIELASLTVEGKVGLNISGDSFSLNIPEDMERGDIYLTNKSAVDVFGAGRGDIEINARNLEISNSLINTGIGLNSFNPEAQAGDINLNATGLVELTNSSFIYNNVDSFGNAGDININANSVAVKNGSQINTQTFGIGNAGNININAADNVTFDNFSSVTSNVFTSAVGKGGDIQITTGSLSVSNLAYISAITDGQGDAGNIIINAAVSVLFNDLGNADSTSLDNAVGNGGDIRIKTGELLLKNGGFLSSLNSGAGNGGNIFLDVRDTINFDGVASNGFVSRAGTSATNGNAGNIDVKTGSLSLTNGGQMDTGALGQENTNNLTNAGNITINARDTVNIDGAFSGLFTELSSGKGKGGDIQITTNSLSVTNGSLLFSLTNGRGNAGNITINAGESVTFDQRGVALTSADINAIGKGGNIQITTDSLFIKNGSQMNSDTFGKGDAGTINLNIKDKIILSGNEQAPTGLFAGTSAESTGEGGSIIIDPPLVVIENGAVVSVGSSGKGDAGDITLQAGTLQLNNGFITAQTASTQGGDINLQIGELLLLRNESQISTTAGTAQAGEDGGNIDINSKFIVSIPEENSDITANAFSGNGGRVDIISNGIFGIETQASLTNFSDITASSETGISGETNINTADTSSIQNSFTELSPNIDTDAIIANSCIVRGNKKQENSFQIVGNEGLPPNRPGNVLTSEYVTGEVRNIDSFNQAWKKGDAIVEPQGLYRMKNGELLLSRECKN